MAQLIWSQRAQRDFIDITNFIASENPKAAERVGVAILAAGKHLVDFPQQGRPGRADGTREKIVTGFPYVLIYIFEGQSVKIARILHAAQQWPQKDIL